MVSVNRFFTTVVVTFISMVCLERCAFSEVIGDFFAFVEAKEPVATIVIGSKADVESDLHFAKILADTIQQVSGVKIAIAEKGQKVKTAGQVIIGTFNEIPLLGTLLVEDGVFKTLSDVHKCGYIRHLLPADLGEQGFVIHKTKRENKEYLLLTGYTDIGTLYAVNTLEDRLHMEGDRLILDGLRTRFVPLVNVPAFSRRSLQTAVGGPDFLGPDQYIKEFGHDYKGFVDWLASHKINNILLHDTSFTFGLCYDSREFPELVNRSSPNVKKEYIGDIIKYGRKRGVTVFFETNWPDRCDCVVKAYPELAGKNVLPDKRGHKTICFNHPRAMEIWKGYWNEILERYPGVEAIGCQFTEHLESRCQCEFCGSDRFFEKELEYFDEMAKIARSKNPPVKIWIWFVPGAREIIARRKNCPDVVYIDWGLRFTPFMFGHYIPRGNWYLYHEYGNNPEFGTKQMCMALHKYGIEGLQIRAVQFKEKDRVFQLFEEFAWNPQLSIEDYAHLYTIKALRRKNKDVARAYAHYIYAQGYYEILKEGANEQQSTKAHRLGMSPNEWVELEGYREEMKEELKSLHSTLEEIQVDCKFVDWLKGRAAELSKLIFGE